MITKNAYDIQVIRDENDLYIINCFMQEFFDCRHDDKAEMHRLSALIDQYNATKSKEASS